MAAFYEFTSFLTTPQTPTHCLWYASNITGTAPSNQCFFHNYERCRSGLLHWDGLREDDCESLYKYDFNPVPNGNAGRCCWSSYEERVVCDSTVEHEKNPYGAPTKRIEFGERGAKVVCWPRTGGVWILNDAGRAELAFLDLDWRRGNDTEIRFSEIEEVEIEYPGNGDRKPSIERDQYGRRLIGGVQRIWPADMEAEDQFCEKLRKMGAQWYRWQEQEGSGWGWCEPIDRCWKPSCTFPYLIGWNPVGAAWIIGKEEALARGGKSMGGYHFAASQQERCQIIAKLEGKYCGSYLDCPEIADVMVGNLTCREVDYGDRGEALYHDPWDYWE